MQDPSQGVQRELQPHVHLLSTHRFPQLAQIHPDKVAEWLLNAPKVARDQAPFYWTYLDRPADGNILLVWQSPSLGLEFPSDGYIWTPQEMTFQVEVAGGYVLEMYQHKQGYAPGEPYATHSRRRYRLLPSRVQQPGAPQPDQSLWIVHYAQAEAHERVPYNVIPIGPHTQAIMQTRQYLHSQGQIVQKDFMLHDRTNWPSIAFPRNPQRAPAYGGNMAPARIPQTMAYPPQHAQHAVAGPPAKRVRTQASASQATVGGAVAVLDTDDEEDTSRGDLFDHTTPREISLARYKQNHEWMEEILSSPYSINQIIPADLGLGLRGELAGLTDGIFDAPADPDKDAIKNNYVGRLDPEKAEEFRKRAKVQIAQTNKEIEKMKAKHAKRLAKLQKGTLIRQAEMELRLAVHDPTDTGPEYWRLEGKIDEEEDEEAKSPVRPPPKVSDIVAQVEASVGRHAAAVKELIRIQDGGYEEAPLLPSPPPVAAPTRQVSPPGSNNGSNHSGVLVGDADMDMSNSAAGLLDQYHTGLSSNATPGSTNNFPTPQPHLQQHSAVGTPSNMHVSSPRQQQQLQQAQNPSGQSVSDPQGTGGDWVVVPPGGVSPSHQAQQQDSHPQPPTSASHELSTPAANTPAQITNTNTNTNPSSAVNTPGLPDFHTSPNDFADLGDLDTAGDALASYGEGEEGLGELSMDIDMDMDVGGEFDADAGESAFEGAFGHHEEHGAEEGLGDGL